MPDKTILIPIAAHPRYDGSRMPIVGLEFANTGNLDALAIDPEADGYDDGFDLTEALEEMAEAAKPRAICADCQHAVNGSPWWRRLFRLPIRIEDYFCDGYPHRKHTAHPITGQDSFCAPGELLLQAGKEIRQRCLLINAKGTCPKFQAR